MVGMSLMTLSILNDARTLANAWTIKSRLGAKLWQDAWTVAMPRTRRARPDTCSDLGARTFLFAWPQVARVGSFSPGQLMGGKLPGRHEGRERRQKLSSQMARTRAAARAPPDRPDALRSVDARAIFFACTACYRPHLQICLDARTSVAAWTL